MTEIAKCCYTCANEGLCAEIPLGQCKSWVINYASLLKCYLGLKDENVDLKKLVVDGVEALNKAVDKISLCLSELEVYKKALELMAQDYQEESGKTDYTIMMENYSRLARKELQS